MSTASGMSAAVRDAWLRSKAGVLNERGLRLIRSGPFAGTTWLYYECPCGGGDHLAARARIKEGLSQYLSPVLNCYETDQQWLVRPLDVAAVIEEEEKKYLQLLEAAPNIVRKVIGKRGRSEETLVFLAETHGIDRELAESILEAEGT